VAYPQGLSAITARIRTQGEDFFGKETMSISKKNRFEVFKRDGFRCVYCGKTPPAVLLEIDHIQPKALGGKDNIQNLVTACFDCNRGKRAIPLNKVPGKWAENIEILKEKEEQYSAYCRTIRKIERRKKREIEAVNKVYTNAFPKWELSQKFKNDSVKHFLDYLTKEELVEAMNIACYHVSDNEKAAIKYFCGICWKKIKGK